MKTIFILAWSMILSCFVLLFTCDAANMQIHVIEKDGLGNPTVYEVWTWDGPDQAHVRRKYTAQEAQGKFDQLFTPAKVGTSKTPSRVFIEYSDVDGLPVKVTPFETGNFKAVDATSVASAKTDATAIKDHIEGQTGKGIDGGTIKKPVEGEPIGGEGVDEPINP